jgi:hypothetical protein
MRRHAVEIDRQIGAHRRQHGGVHAAKHRIPHHVAGSPDATGRRARDVRPGQSTT